MQRKYGSHKATKNPRVNRRKPQAIGNATRTTSAERQAQESSNEGVNVKPKSIRNERESAEENPEEK
jgi:hypothetical protein